jgi:PAS domain S-box-containing protein
MDAAATPKASLLLVDDHAGNLVTLEAILGPLGHELVTALSGEEALGQLLRRNFALILLDVQMAGMNGFELAGIIKRHPRSRHVPIIFMTAVGKDAAHVFRGYSEGAVDYLVKPFDPDILRAKVSVFVNLYLKEQTIKAQEQLLREHQREMLERESEARYRRLLDAMPQCIWATDATGHVDYWNRAGLDYCGLEAGEVTEESFWDQLHPEDRAAARADWERDKSGHIPLERPIRLRNAATGEYRWHLTRAVPERDDSGAITGWIATATDIDDQKRAEQTLEATILLRDDFLSVASHELRTPLTSLKLEAANLLRRARRGDLTSDRLVTRLERIDAQAARMHRLINELLDVSRIVAGRLELSLEEVDLVQVVGEVVAQFKDEAARAGCALTSETPRAAIGHWDRSRLEQVVTNLVTNAIKYGGGKPITVEVAEHDDRIKLTVRDHGLGIPTEDQDRIFERFERAASTRNYSGIGLGLWIVKQIVEALGGTVIVDSAPERGSAFTVELPRWSDAVLSRPAGGAVRHASFPELVQGAARWP